MLTASSPSCLFPTVPFVQYLVPALYCDLSRLNVNKAHPCTANLQVAGILVTNFNQRNPSANRYITVFEKMARNMETIVFQQKIRRGISVTEYLTKQMDLLKYDTTGNPSMDYKQFTKEFLKRIRTMEEAKKHG